MIRVVKVSNINNIHVFLRNSIQKQVLVLKIAVYYLISLSI